MGKTITAVNQHGESLDVGFLDAGNGIRLAFTETQSVSTAPLDGGVYLVGVTVDAFMRVAESGVAGDLAGSFPVGAGSSGSIFIKAGHRVSVRGVSGAGSLLIVPFEKT